MFLAIFAYMMCRAIYNRTPLIRSALERPALGVSDGGANIHCEPTWALLKTLDRHWLWHFRICTHLAQQMHFANNPKHISQSLGSNCDFYSSAGVNELTYSQNPAKKLILTFLRYPTHHVGKNLGKLSSFKKAYVGSKVK